MTTLQLQLPPSWSLRSMDASRRKTVTAAAAASHMQYVASVETTLQEVSEDSSIDDDDDSEPYNNIVQTKNVTSSTVHSNNKKRKTRRNTMSTARQSATAQRHDDQQYHHPPSSKMPRSFSHPGASGRNRENPYGDVQYAEDDATTDYHHRRTNDVTNAGTDVMIARGGVACPFPWKLHAMLDYCCPAEGGTNDQPQQQIVTWNETGTAFAVLDTKLFLKMILPRFFAQSKYASFQRQLNLYGFTRESIPSKNGNDGGKTKSYSFYSHPYFIREDRTKVQFMVRCKIKGTGKKRFSTEEDCEDRGDLCQHNNSADSGEEDYDGEEEEGDEMMNYPSKERFNVEPVMTRTAPDLWSDEIASPVIEHCKEPLTELHDGDLLYFDGHPFHFLNPKNDIVTIHDTSTSESLPSSMNMPPLFPPLGSAQPVPVRTRYRNFLRSVLLENEYNFYRDSSALRNDQSHFIPRNDSSLLGVFDHHFYDVHPPKTTVMYRYNDLPGTKFSQLPTSNLSMAWSKRSYQNGHATAI